MGTIEERTIGLVGGGSYMVTLPKGWLRFHHLKAGDKVVVVTNGELRIWPKRKERRRAPRPGKVRKGNGEAAK